MGGYDLACSVSGLPLGESIAMILAKDAPVAVPLWGAFDGYGGIELAGPSPTATALWPLMKASGHPTAVDLDVLSQLLNADTIAETWSNAEAFLVHGPIFRAIVETVTTDNQDVRRLAASPIDELFAAALPSEVSRDLYANASREALRPDLVGLIALRHWPAKLERRECADQYYTEDDLGRANALTESWRSYPRLAAAIDEAIAAWRRHNE